MERHIEEQWAMLKNVLDGVSNEELRSLGIEALRQWRAGRPQVPQGRPLEQHCGDVFSLHGDLGMELIRLLVEKKQLKNIDISRAKEPLVDDEAMGTVWLSGFNEFIWWLERSGLAAALRGGFKAVPQYPGARQPRSYPTSMRLTARGKQFLDRQDADDPLLPGFLDRLVLRSPSVPDGAIALLVDARACMDHSLLRPAVVLMGVAYELMIEEVFPKLATKGCVTNSAAAAEAGERVKRIRDFLKDDNKVRALGLSRDGRRKAEAAYDFADTLRLRRNEAAHTKPLFDFEHYGETEEFLVSAGRHVPGIWSLYEAADQEPPAT